MAQVAGSRNISDIIRTSQQKAISTGLLTFALIVVLLIGSFRPTIKTISETSKKLEIRENALQTLTKHNSNLTSLREEQLNLDSELKALDYYFPSDGDFSLFVTNLNEIASSNNLNLESVSFSSNYNKKVEDVAAIQYDEMTPITFQVALKGSPEDLSRFLSFIESTPFLPKVLSIGYSPNRILTQETSLSITLLVYQMNSSATGYE